MGRGLLDVGEAIADALARPEVANALADMIAERVVARLGTTAAVDDRLAPLASILRCSASAARMRVTRDRRLRALGTPVGERGTLHFRPSEVLRYLRERGDAHTPRAVSGLRAREARVLDGTGRART